MPGLLQSLLKKQVRKGYYEAVSVHGPGADTYEHCDPFCGVSGGNFLDLMNLIDLLSFERLC
jgi:hypothetical protein